MSRFELGDRVLNNYAWFEFCPDSAWSYYSRNLRCRRTCRNAEERDEISQDPFRRVGRFVLTSGGVRSCRRLRLGGGVRVCLVVALGCASSAPDPGYRDSNRNDVDIPLVSYYIIANLDEA